MKKSVLGIFCVMICGGLMSADGESLLKPMAFPKVFNDLPFTTRMQVLSDGYGQVETVYDKNGRCISGCAYPGITIEQELAAIDRNTRMAGYASGAGAVFDTLGTVIDTPVAPTACRFYTDAERPGKPNRAPIAGNIIITSDFGPRQRPTTGASNDHRGIDISAATGTPVYATADGTIEKVDESTGAGKYIWIRHSDTRYRTVYMHLSKNDIFSENDTVHAGDKIGESGNTGVSTGPHLHYGIYYTQPGKNFDSQADMIDPIWPTNWLNTNFRFKEQSAKSCRHKSNGYCGEDPAPSDTLPCEIKYVD